MGLERGISSYPRMHCGANCQKRYNAHRYSPTIVDKLYMQIMDVLTFDLSETDESLPVDVALPGPTVASIR